MAAMDDNKQFGDNESYSSTFQRQALIKYKEMLTLHT